MDVNHINYEELLQNLKKDYFPELKKVKIKLKPLRILKKVFMITLPFTSNIYYNRRVIKQCSLNALKAVFMHELSHIIQFKKMNFLQKIVFLPRYHLCNRYRIKHELEAHTEVVKRGFGRELIDLNNFVRKRYPQSIWDKKFSKYYLTEEEIMKNM